MFIQYRYKENMKKLFAIFFVSILSFATAANARPTFRVPSGFNHAQMGFAQDRQNNDGRNYADQGRILSLRDIAQIINSQVPGSVLDAQGPYDKNGRKVYHVRWQSNRGAIIDFEVDAESGQILSRAGG